MGTHPIFESDFDCLTVELRSGIMQDTRCICKYTHHLKQPMICCDKCQKWQHTHCMGITDAKFSEFNKQKDLVYHCEKCEPRDIDYNAARAYQSSLAKKFKLSQNQEDIKTSTDTGSTDDDEFGLRRPSRDERKAIEYEKLFEKMKQEENSKERRQRRSEKKKELSDNEQQESDDDHDVKKSAKGRRGRPRGSKRRIDIKENEESAIQK